MTQTEGQAHTPGKRVVRGTRVGVIDQRDGVLIMTAKAFSGTGSSLAEQEANARRLAACENACEDIPTEALEAGAVTDLLAACEVALDGLHYTREYVGEATLPAIEGWSWYDATVALKAAIAKARVP
jgi:hypothetical protein